MLTADGAVITKREFQAGEGLTVVFTWPKGLIAPPPPPKRNNVAAQTAVASAVLIFICLWLGYAWNNWGREPLAKAIIPLFYPSDDISPACARYVYKMRLDMTGFAAAIIGLAVKGAIKITEEEKGGKKKRNVMTLKKEPVTPDNLKPEEALF